MSIDFDLDAAGIATITINRPERMNSLDADHYRSLSQIWTRVRDDHAVRCAIVTGAGEKSFCAGADIKVSIGQKTELRDHWLTQQELLLNRGLEIWKPVIAAVNGYCLGGGMTLLLATDIRIAAQHAEFGLSEVKRGIIAGSGGTQRIMRQLPHPIAMELLLTGDRITAVKAERWGLINAIVPPEILMATAREYAERIIANAPLAVQATKELAIRSCGLSLADGVRMEQMTNLILQQISADVQEGRSAFLEKRAPRFSGE